MPSTSRRAHVRRRAARARSPRPAPARRAGASAGRRPGRASPRGTAAGRAARRRTPTRCRAPVRRPPRTASASALQLRELVVVEAQRARRSSGATSSSKVPPSAAARIAIFLRPGVRSSTAPARSMRKRVGDHAAGDDDLAEPPARLDQPLVGAVDRVLREHHPGDVGIEQRLDDDADARPGEQADPLAVGDRRVGVRRPPDLADRRAHVVDRRHVEQREVLAGEARVGAVLVGRRRAHRERRRAAAAPRSRAARSRSSSPAATASTNAPDERDAGRDRQPGARRRAQPGRLRAEPRSSSRVGERDDLAAHA